VELSYARKGAIAKFASCAQPATPFHYDCYDGLCFGVFALSVEIRPSAAGGTCVS
jgi:hypothetical protein